MKFIDLFAGIGGFRFGMESAGHECVAFCEIDKFARASYKAIHDTEGIVGTLTATDYKGPKQVAIPVLTPDRANKRQNGRRFKTDGEPMFTLTGQDRHGIVVAGNLAGSHEQNGRIYDVNGIYPTLNTMQGGDSQGVVTSNFRIRKLTPRECWRLQGFPDWAFDKAQEVNSNSQLYKQAGNSVTVNVIKEIARYL